MVTQHVFSAIAANDPMIISANDSTPYSLCTLVEIGAEGEITRGRWRFPSTLPTGSAVQHAFFEYVDDTTAGALLGIAEYTSPVAGQWCDSDLLAPTLGGSAAAIPASPGDRVYSVVWTPNHYVVTGGYFNGHAEVSGDLTAPADDSGTPRRNGRFNDFGTGPQYPDNQFNQACYWADLVFESGPTVHDGAAALTADGVLTGAGIRVVSGAAALTADAVLTGAGLRVAAGAAAFTADGTLVGNGVRITSGSAAFSAQSAATLTPAGTGVGRRSSSAVSRRSSAAVPRRS